jgi:hypothetical protein
MQGYEPVKVRAPKQIKPAHIEALDGFISFSEGGVLRETARHEILRQHKKGHAGELWGL